MGTTPSSAAGNGEASTPPVPPRSRSTALGNRRMRLCGNPGRRSSAHATSPMEEVRRTPPPRHTRREARPQSHGAPRAGRAAGAKGRRHDLRVLGPDSALHHASGPRNPTDARQPAANAGRRNSRRTSPGDPAQWPASARRHGSGRTSRHRAVDPDIAGANRQPGRTWTPAVTSGDRYWRTDWRTAASARSADQRASGATFASWEVSNGQAGGCGSAMWRRAMSTFTSGSVATRS